jgi:hypothetical protein
MPFLFTQLDSQIQRGIKPTHFRFFCLQGFSTIWMQMHLPNTFGGQGHAGGTRITSL